MTVHRGHQGGTPRGGFSLIELLIVVAIISILAGIAVPNYLEAQTRAKVARVQADMRSLDVAFAAYHIDHNDFAVRRSDFGDPSLGIDPQPNTYYPCWQNRLKQMSAVTTPVSYISTIPIDPFESRIPEPNNTFDYLDGVQTAKFVKRARFAGDVPERGYVLLSVGPDGLIGHTIAEYGTSFCPASYPHENQSRTTMTRFYDPTNGSVSFGNIYRFNGWANDESTLRP